MKRHLPLLLLVLLAGLALYLVPRQRREINRLKANQHALHTSLDRYRTRLGEEAASVEALRLKTRELRTLGERDARTIRSLRIRLRRAEALAENATRSLVSLSTPLRDTVTLRDTVLLHDTLPIRDTIRLFRWQDNWVTVRGSIRDDSLHCLIESVDTLRQVIHRVPRRFLFIRWGTKAIRQEIISSNPHTRIVYSRYLKIER